MKKCPYCNHMNRDDAETCKKCSASLPSEVKKEQPKKAAKKTESKE